MPPADPSGWAWFETASLGLADGADPLLARQAARIFASPDGEAVMAHLRRLTLERSLSPDAGDAALRHLEGQRHLVLHLLALAERGLSP